MNKSVMKCCICNNENIGEFITINDKKYHLCCIEQLQQENQELKEQVQDLKEKIILLKASEPMLEYKKALEENQQKKFIEYLEDLIKFYKNRDSYMVADILGSYDLNNIELEVLKEILSKYKEIIGENKDEK